MKKFFLLLVIMLAGASFSHAQLASGKYMIGGSLGFNSGGPSWNLSPSAGYMLTDDIGVGASINANDPGNGLIMGVGVAARKYWNIMDKTYLYGHAGLNLGVVGGGGVGLSVYPGVMYFINDRLAIDGALNGLAGGGIGMSLLF